MPYCRFAFCVSSPSSSSPLTGMRGVVAVLSNDDNYKMKTKGSGVENEQTNKKKVGVALLSNGSTHHAVSFLLLFSRRGCKMWG